MDDRQVSRAKVTIHTAIYNMEYAACFINDSAGFFKRSLIESCVTNDSTPISVGGKEISFDAVTQGNLSCKYKQCTSKYNSRVVIYTHRGFIRLSSDWLTDDLQHTIRVC